MDDASMYPDRRILKGDLRTSSDCNEIALVTQVVVRATEIARRIFDELCALRDDCTISSFETTFVDVLRCWKRLPSLVVGRSWLEPRSNYRVERLRPLS